MKNKQGPTSSRCCSSSSWRSMPRSCSLNEAVRARAALVRAGSVTSRRSCLACGAVVGWLWVGVACASCGLGVPSLAGKSTGRLSPPSAAGASTTRPKNLVLHWPGFPTVLLRWQPVVPRYCRTAISLYPPQSPAPLPAQWPTPPHTRVPCGAWPTRPPLQRGGGRAGRRAGWAARRGRAGKQQGRAQRRPQQDTPSSETQRFNATRRTPQLHHPPLLRLQLALQAFDGGSQLLRGTHSHGNEPKKEGWAERSTARQPGPERAAALRRLDGYSRTGRQPGARTPDATVATRASTAAAHANCQQRQRQQREPRAVLGAAAAHLQAVLHLSDPLLRAPQALNSPGGRMPAGAGARSGWLAGAAPQQAGQLRQSAKAAPLSNSGGLHD